MTTTIDTIVLDRDMVWTDEFAWTAVRSEATPTIGGGDHVQSYTIPESGRPITLESRNKQGAQRKATVAALKALSEIPGGEYSLSISHNGISFSRTVRFRNEIDGGAVQFSMRNECDGLARDTAWYDGIIYLSVV